MDYANLGNSELEVSRLCLGTWNMAGQQGWGPEDDERSVSLIRRVQDSGCNYFDTAHGYGRGHAEEVLGRALSVEGRREKAVVVTKIVQCDPDNVEPSLDAALDRLQTDQLDVYVVHWPRPSLSLEAFFEKMAEMREKGKTREIGVSNFDREQMGLADDYGVVSLQPPYNPLWRLIEPEVLPFCREKNIAVTPYSPLAQGLLTGRFSRTSEEATGIRKKNVLFEEPVFSEARKAASVVDRVADELGCFSSQVALAWLLHTPGVTSPIVGVSSWDQWEANVGSLEIELRDEQYEDISEAGMSVWNMLPEDPTMWGYKPE